MCFFFFFKQKTAYEMRISDWSSDVCSSDLNMNMYLLCSSYASTVNYAWSRRLCGSCSSSSRSGRGLHNKCCLLSNYDVAQHKQYLDLLLLSLDRKRVV